MPRTTTRSHAKASLAQYVAVTSTCQGFWRVKTIRFPSHSFPTAGVWSHASRQRCRGPLANVSYVCIVCQKTYFMLYLMFTWMYSLLPLQQLPNALFGIREVAFPGIIHQCQPACQTGNLMIFLLAICLMTGKDNNYSKYQWRSPPYDDPS